MSRCVISVVITVCRTHHCLELVLRALENQPLSKADLECIVVVDIPIDAALAEVLEGSRGSIRLSVLRNRGAIGRSMSRNRGWRAATGHLVAFLSEDTIPFPHWLATLRQAIEEKPGVVSGPNIQVRVPARGSDLMNALARSIGCDPSELLRNNILSQYEYLATHSTPGRCTEAWRQEFDQRLNALSELHPRSPVRGGYINGANLMIPREILDTTGGFAPLMGEGEDFDFGIRVSQDGYAVAIADAALACQLMDSLQGDSGWTDLQLRGFVYRHPTRAAAMLPRCFEAERSSLMRPAANSPLPTQSELWMGEFDYTAQEAICLFSATAGIDYNTTEKFINTCVADELLVKDLNDVTYFDIYHTSNLLRTTTLYQAYCLRNASFARTHLTPRQCQEGVTHPITIHCRGEYAVELEMAPDISWDLVDVNLSIPIEHTCQQNLRITHFMPPELEKYLDVKNGILANIPSSLFLLSDARIGYEFDCDIHEAIMPTMPPASGSAVKVIGTTRPGYLRFSFPLTYRDQVASLLDHILDGQFSDPGTDARRIFEWIVDNLSYSNNLLRDYSILDTGVGNCQQLGRLFANLVRLRGIPAREQCGALMCRGISDSEIVTIAKEYSPFGHTWIEVLLEGKGWCPAEFVVMRYGEWETTRFNVDGALRTEMVKQSSQLARYYFGNIDPYRIYTSGYANGVPPIVLRGCGEKQQRHRHLLTQLNHRLKCSIAPLD